jgi:hypothetical protein
MASFTDTENRAIQFLSDGQVSFTLPGEDIAFSALAAQMCAAGHFPFNDLPTEGEAAALWQIHIIRPGDPVGSFASHIIRS